MIRYDLQFFAKDGPGGQKTEPATAKKLNEARKKGQVAKSRDLTGSITLLAFFIILKIYVGAMGEKFIREFHKSFTHIGELNSTSLQLEGLPAYASNIMSDAMLNILLILMPIMLVAVVIAFVGDIIQVKWKPSTEQMKPKLDKFNPISGFKRIFSVRSLVQLAKSVAIVAICVLVTYNKIKKSIGMLFNLYEVSLQAAIYNMGDLIISVGIVISVIYLIVGIGDYLFELFKFKEEMKMTKQEVKDEWKETEGSPEVKGAVRRKMMEASRRRMMQAVPEADVVITNPTHFAVALKYEQNSGQAPIVIAKGEDYLAQKIKEVARENEVEIVENKPLARMLYYNVELGMEIPQELYQAVAEVLAFVWKLKHKI